MAKQPTLTACMQRALELLQDRQFHRLDKLVGHGLVRRGLAVARRSPEGRGYQYRLPGPEPVATPSEGLQTKPKTPATPLLTWIENQTTTTVTSWPFSLTHNRGITRCLFS
jgi:hypothetical protein